MSTQRAILIQGPGDAQVVSDAPMPKLRDSYLIVKTKAVALNPTDWMHIDYMPSKGAIVGCDFSGTVEEVGKSVTKNFKVGDRVVGATHGGMRFPLLISQPFQKESRPKRLLITAITQETR